VNADLDRLAERLALVYENWTDVELAADQVHDPELWARGHTASQAILSFGNRVAQLRREEREATV
jgi:hypothetical protein